MSELKVTNPEEYAALETPGDEIELVEMPSGAVFKMRRLDMAGMVLIGALPQSLVNIGMAAWRQQGKAEAAIQKISEQDEEDTIKQLIFMRNTVVENVLEPRIGYSPDGVVSLLRSDGSAITGLKRPDFVYAFRWITRQEGKEAPGLTTFRGGSERGTVDAGADGQELRSEAEPISEPVETVQ